MKIYDWNSLDGSCFSKKTCMTVGVFDGIHAGHKKLLEKVIDVSKNNSFESGVVTFSDSIFSMFKSSEVPLQTLEERIRTIEKMGFDFLILIDFTPEVAHTDGLEFLKNLKLKCFLTYLVEGEDFRLGDGGRIGKKEIEKFCLENEIGYDFIPPVLFQGQRISSTMIRKMKNEGDYETVSILLG